MDKRQSNAAYYERTKDRIILRDFELRPSTILEIIDCLESLELHGGDKRIERLKQLYVDITGEALPSTEGDDE